MKFLTVLLSCSIGMLLIKTTFAMNHPSPVETNTPVKHVNQSRTSTVLSQLKRAIEEVNTETVFSILNAQENRNLLGFLLMLIDENGNTLLHLACQQREGLSIVKYILNAVSTVMEVDRFSRDATFWEDILLAKNNMGDTPLHIAIRIGNPTIISELVREAYLTGNQDKLLKEKNIMGKTPYE